MIRSLSLLLLSVFLTSASAEDRPNILLIFADDVGQEVLECYGGQSYSTPHLNELARTGMTFRHAYSMPVCHPSRLTLMTGKYPFRCGPVTWGDFPKSEEAACLPRLLQQAGYKTAIAGKWQLCLLQDDPQQPARMGFDQWDLFGWHEGPRFYEPMIYHNGTVREDTLGHYGPDVYVRSMIEFMKANQDQPFFAMYSMALCHEVTDDLDPPVPHGPFGRYDSYEEMVHEMDRAIGRLLGALDALKLREKTLVVFVADNGTPPEIIIRAEGKKLIKVPVSSVQNGRIIPGGKKQLTDAGTNVPMIVNWPGTIRPNQVVRDLVDFSDLLPTFVDLAKAKPIEQRDGHSFANRLLDQGAGTRTFAYCEEAVLPKPGGVEPDGTSSGLKWVRNRKWKLYNDGRLFHMVEDPFENYAFRTAIDSATSRSARQQLKAAFEELGL